MSHAKWQIAILYGVISVGHCKCINSDGLGCYFYAPRLSRPTLNTY